MMTRPDPDFPEGQRRPTAVSGLVPIAGRSDVSPAALTLCIACANVYVSLPFRSCMSSVFTYGSLSPLRQTETDLFHLSHLFPPSSLSFPIYLFR